MELQLKHSETVESANNIKVLEGQEAQEKLSVMVKKLKKKKIFILYVSRIGKEKEEVEKLVIPQRRRPSPPKE